MSWRDLSDSGEWTNVKGSPLTLPEYLSSVIQTGASTASIVIALAELSAPILIRRQGVLCGEDFITDARLAELKRQISSVPEVEYWANLVSISEIFGSILTPAQCEFVARKLKTAWEGQLCKHDAEGYGCRIISEDEEWYLTICKNSVSPDGKK